MRASREWQTSRGNGNQLGRRYFPPSTALCATREKPQAKFEREPAIKENSETIRAQATKAPASLLWLHDGGKKSQVQMKWNWKRRPRLHGFYNQMYNNKGPSHSRQNFREYNQSFCPFQLFLAYVTGKKHSDTAIKWMLWPSNCIPEFLYVWIKIHTLQISACYHHEVVLK